MPNPKSMRMFAAAIAFGLFLAPSAHARTDQPIACPAFLRTNPDVLRTVKGYAQGSARNPNMSADQTVNFIASTITAEVRRSASPEAFNNNASLYYKSLENIDRSIISKCWPDLNAVISEKERREALATDTQRKHSEVQERKEREAQAEQLEKARKQAAADALPANRLQRAYRVYIAIKRCFDAREGYAVVYINEEQTQKARKWVLRIETFLRKEDPAINSDAIWEQANGPDKTIPSNELAAVIQFADQFTLQHLSTSDWNDDAESFCGRSFDTLNQLHLSIDPDARSVKKDF